MSARFPLLLALLGAGCSGPDFAPESISETSLAINVCDETVPSERAVDGFPAYAQCDAVANTSVWSNNGIDTSATSLGDDWVLTQRGGGYQCTEWAYRYMRFRWDVDYRHGNAEEWCDGDLPSTLVKTTTPVHGDLIVFAGGVCGAAEDTGHIAVVDTVDAAAEKVTIVEQNRAGRRSTNQSCATCFLHAVANDGSLGGTGGAAGRGNAGAAGSSPGGSSGAGGSDGLGGRSSGGFAGSSALGGRAGTAGSGGAMASAGAPASAGAGTGAGAGAAVGGHGGSGAAAGRASTSGGSSSVSVGGSTATGGNATAGAPAAGAPAGDASELDSEPDEAGCSVAIGSRERSGSAAALGLLLVGLAVRRRGRPCEGVPW